LGKLKKGSADVCGCTVVVPGWHGLTTIFIFFYFGNEKSPVLDVRAFRHVSASVRLGRFGVDAKQSHCGFAGFFVGLFMRYLLVRCFLRRRVGSNFRSRSGSWGLGEGGTHREGGGNGGGDQFFHGCSL
jgi:hypothetical protein